MISSRHWSFNTYTLAEVICIYNAAAMEIGFRKGVSSILVGGNSPLNGGSIVWPPATQHKHGNLSKSWDLAKTEHRTEIPNWSKLAAVMQAMDKKIRL